jgi:hypothetical protein
MSRVAPIICCISLYIVLAAADTSWAHCWENVQPSVQQYQNPTGMDLPIARARIYYVGDTLWAAHELEWQLDHLPNPVDAYVPPRGYPARGVMPPPQQNERIITLGLWSSSLQWFLETDYPQFHMAPDSEEYYVFVDPNSPFIHITASTIRGLNYAVTSLWQAICTGTPPTIGAGAIRDFPFFPKRFVMDKYDLTAIDTHGVDLAPGIGTTLKVRAKWYIIQSGGVYGTG